MDTTKKHPETGEDLYLEQTPIETITDAGYVWRGDSGAELELTREELNEVYADLDTGPTIAD